MKCDILVLSPEFGYGGIGNHTLKIVNFLLDEGFRVRVYTIKNRKVRSLLHSNFEIEEITRPILGFDKFNPFFDAVSYLRLMGKKKPSLIIRPVPPFYLHVPWISNTVIPELAISHGVQRASIETFKAKGKMDVKDKYLFSAVGKMLIESSEQNMLHKAKRIVAVSEYTKRQLVKQYNLDEEKIEVIHNFVDNNVFKRRKNNEITSEIGNKIKDFKKSSLLAVFVGRPTAGKNLSLVYDIIRNFSNEPDLKFVIVGMKRNDKYVEEYATRLNRSNVLFLGNVDNNLLPDVYSLSDFLLITSLDENLPTVLLEAMACGTIPISTNVGGIPEVIEDYENGFLVRLNKEDFLNIIRYLISCDHRTLNVISRNAEKSVKEKFSAKITRKKYVDIVNEIISM
jgi:glycosyltransferase involved in cell wall biosynthesis